MQIYRVFDHIGGMFGVYDVGELDSGRPALVAEFASLSDAWVFVFGMRGDLAWQEWPDPRRVAHVQHLIDESRNRERIARLAIC